MCFEHLEIKKGGKCLNKTKKLKKKNTFRCPGLKPGNKIREIEKKIDVEDGEEQTHD